MRFLPWIAYAGCTFLFASAAPAFADTTSTTSTIPLAPTTSTAPLILQMSDGRFYHPVSGIMADSRETLLFQLGLGAPPASSSPISTTSTDGLLPATSTLPVPGLVTPPPVPALLQAVYDAQATLASTPVDPKRAIDKQRVWVSALLWDTQAQTSRREDVSVGLATAWKYDGYTASWFSPKTHEVVIAVRRPSVDRVKVKKVYTYPTRGYSVFTPYSRALETPEIVAIGKQLLQGWVDDAYATLNAKRVHSSAFPSRLVSEIIDPVLPKSIVAIEHLDRPSLANRGEQALIPFYTRIALNRKEAYSKETSTAGARGLAQFMKATYQSVQRRHADVGLPVSYDEAMRQTDISILANILYLDDLLAELPGSARSMFLSDVNVASEYLVAAYNGGPARIGKAMEYWDRVTSGSVEQLNAAKAEGTKLQTALKKAKKQLAAATTKKAKSTKQAAVNALLKKIEANAEEQARLAKTRLRKETVTYLLKYRIVHDFMAKTL